VPAAEPSHGEPRLSEGNNIIGDDSKIRKILLVLLSSTVETELVSKSSQCSANRIRIDAIHMIDISAAKQTEDLPNA
jgi:hypothetical protein